jgi:hypothetical protein
VHGLGETPVAARDALLLALEQAAARANAPAAPAAVQASPARAGA